MSAQPGWKKRLQDTRRKEAEERNAKSDPQKRRSYWRALGFFRQSEAARVVRKGVAEGQAAIDDMREHQASDHESLWSIGPDLESALKHSAEGKVVDLGDFTQYADQR